MHFESAVSNALTTLRLVNNGDRPVAENVSFRNWPYDCTPKSHDFDYKSPLLLGKAQCWLQKNI